MYMHKCEECERTFEEPKWKTICFEQEYGVSNLFESRTYTTVQVCPYCGETSIIEIDEEDIESDFI